MLEAEEAFTAASRRLNVAALNEKSISGETYATR
jgi:hypothetical protein